MEKEIKELIEEMKLRHSEFLRVTEFSLPDFKDYWRGKKSEAAFVIEKLEMILNDKP